MKTKQDNMVMCDWEGGLAFVHNKNLFLFLFLFLLGSRGWDGESKGISEPQTDISSVITKEIVS